jgi:hypothetical protein
MGFGRAARTCPFGLINTLLSLLMYKKNPAKNISLGNCEIKQRPSRTESTGLLLIPMLKYGDWEMVI